MEQKEITAGKKFKLVNIEGKDKERCTEGQVVTFVSRKTMFGKDYWYFKELEKPIEVRKVLSK